MPSALSTTSVSIYYSPKLASAQGGGTYMPILLRRLPRRPFLHAEDQCRIRARHAHVVEDGRKCPTVEDAAQVRVQRCCERGLVRFRTTHPAYHVPAGDGRCRRAVWDADSVCCRRSGGREV